jgi:N-acetylglucosaminyldiphosphoundecaprenol N-acetyl-beta-D-mannosaminyltransferase
VTGSDDFVNVLGVKVSAINMQRAVAIIDGWIQSREQHYVTITGVHGIMESQRDPSIRDIHNRAGLVTPDGMPLVWISHRRGRRDVERVYGPDLLLELCSISDWRGYRHYFYGGAPGVAEQLADRLRARYPALQVVGTYCPPFRPMSEDEDSALVTRMNEADPDIIWVGLSTPKQERWMHAHIGRLSAPVLIGVGAAFDFHAGLKAQAPKWMQRNGLEWLFRLKSEPRRLWKRYLRNNPSFVALILLQELGLRRYPVASVETPSGQS